MTVFRLLQNISSVADKVNIKEKKREKKKNIAVGTN